ncbi:Sulfotransferase domain protein [Candidatus Pelagibacter ubique HTCC1002]|mgnify:FL=1|jgi:hypothetical protein|uniref:Sulfotransferase domain protein n=1 Tax=Pelagibacter ubique (strain HTCC1002) TaxID=314261 RepID=Q1V1A6_PELU1|nr:sulfotransferase domain-containing protein [Candidatus Pelagibacter ubique]EAS84972.1 Sulfotransferase domain protein [Candidatus Pelagibacter ubique HTCC1002]MDC0907257.1 sulfotransferase domain-containing protein [Candidatus Pelagibacter ubique]
MIIWLASYPKSGNTWVRLFLDSLLFKQDANVNINDIGIKQFPLRGDFNGLTDKIDDENEFVKNCNLAQTKINLDNEIKFLKTHHALWRNGNYSFTNTENTLGVIHIIRDPRNVITSILNHFNRDDYVHALEFMKNPLQCIGDRERGNSADLMTIISSWGNHYSSWRKFKKNNLLIKYEDLINKPEEEFLKLCNFVEKITSLKFEKNLVLKAIKNCEFDKLNRQEETNGFREGAKNIIGKNNKFFYLGPKNNWKKLLNKEIKCEIEKLFEKEMLEIGYL